MKTIYGYLSDNGDGSSSLHWFSSKEDFLQIEQDDPVTWGSNESTPAVTLQIPDSFSEIDLLGEGFEYFVPEF